MDLCIVIKDVKRNDAFTIMSRIGDLGLELNFGFEVWRTLYDTAPSLVVTPPATSREEEDEPTI